MDVNTAMLSKKILLLFFLFLFLEIMISSIVLYSLSINETKNYLQKITARVNEDIKFENGKWNTSLYNADSEVPDGSNPLYVITSDGFVIDRWKPIHGFLDASRFNRLLAYTEPETINTVSNENWRIVSKPIVSGKQTIGVITVAAYNPLKIDNDQIDKQLSLTIDAIKSKLAIHGDSINADRLDSRRLPYNISFQVVNHFNKLLTQSDNTSSITHTPTFIDSSYVYDQLRDSSIKTVQDSLTHRKYLTMATPIYDSNKSVVGIVIAASPIAGFPAFVGRYTLWQIIVTLLLGIFLVPITRELIKSNLKNASKTQNIEHIAFLKKESKLMIDDHVIDIPYASFQYYFCDAMFSKPQKRWEVDELSEKFGEEVSPRNWRKVYDTMTALNKKVYDILKDKLFVVRDKTYSLNPFFLTKIIHDKD